MTPRKWSVSAEKRSLAAESEFREILWCEFGVNMSDEDIDRCVAVMKAKGTGDAPHPFFA
jgi:N-hydroxyarylamine O-acetyltransferase